MVSRTPYHAVGSQLSTSPWVVGRGRLTGLTPSVTRATRCAASRDRSPMRYQCGWPITDSSPWAANRCSTDSTSSAETGASAVWA